MNHALTQLRALADLAEKHDGSAVIYSAGFGDGTVDAYVGDHTYAVEPSGETIYTGACSELDVSELVA